MNRERFRLRIIFRCEEETNFQTQLAILESPGNHSALCKVIREHLAGVKQRRYVSFLKNNVNTYKTHRLLRISAKRSLLVWWLPFNKFLIAKLEHFSKICRPYNIEKVLLKIMEAIQSVLMGLKKNNFQSKAQSSHLKIWKIPFLTFSSGEMNTENVRPFKGNYLKNFFYHFNLS